MLSLRTMLLASSLLLWNAPRICAATISIQPANTPVSVGGSFSVDINIASITDLYAYQFDLTFDLVILSATGVTAGLFLSGGAGFLPGPSTTPWTITFTADSLTGPVPGVTGAGHWPPFSSRRLLLARALSRCPILSFSIRFCSTSRLTQRQTGQWT